MSRVMDSPLLVFVLSFVGLSICAWIGAVLFRLRRAKDDAPLSETFGVIQAATLTLLGLIIGFTFSMALNRYDQRKNYEEDEANAIGTEYVRAALLPSDDAAQVRTLLASYLHQRILLYQLAAEGESDAIRSATSQLQDKLWSAVVAPATAHSNPVVATVVTGMNDVLNSEGYTQAAWWNRIPFAAWWLMTAIAICCNVLVGYGSKANRTGHQLLLLVLPLVVSLAFMLIADIDSPHGGFIRVSPVNLVRLSQTMPSQ